MTTADIIHIAGTQAIKLPPDIHFEGDQVSIRRAGNAIVVEPLAPAAWPDGFWETIHISDPAFTRPAQGQLPPAPVFE